MTTRPLNRGIARYLNAAQPANPFKPLTPHKFVPQFPQVKGGDLRVVIATASTLAAQLKKLADMEMGRLPQDQDVDCNSPHYNPNISREVMKP